MAKLPKASELVKLRKKGLTYEQIGDMYGASRQAVHQKINYRIRRTPKPHKVIGKTKMKPKKKQAKRR